MAKNKSVYRLLFPIAVCLCMLPARYNVAQTGLRSAARSVMSPRDKLREVYTAELGVREATGHNDGQRVGQYLAYCSLRQGRQWCAAFVSWCYGRIGRAAPHNPWAPALVPDGRLVYKQGKALTRQPMPGDVFGIYHAGMRRVAHVGFVDSWEQRYALTVEGNSHDAVERRRRPHATIYKVADWVSL
ncbi:MAG: CHAP domain-containing protein [Sphingobacteriales bacterium]|nr:MAG: CHAP domain-containing protein [Sphingobacteriales bacterium]